MFEIFLFGDVGYDFTDVLFAEKLVEAGGQDVIVHINSMGGDVFQGQAILALMKSYPGNVEVRIDGLAASAASLIAMGGDKVLISEGGMLMVHNPLVMLYGNAAELREMADILDKIGEVVIAAAYVAKTGKTMKQVKALMDAETWLSSEEAVKQGFVDGVAETKAVLNRLSAKFAAYRNTPESLRPEQADEPSPFARLSFAALKGSEAFLAVVTQTEKKEQAESVQEQPVEKVDLSAFEARLRLLAL